MIIESAVILATSVWTIGPVKEPIEGPDKRMVVQEFVREDGFRCKVYDGDSRYPRHTICQQPKPKKKKK